MMDSKKYAQRLIEIATKKHKDAGGILDDFLDYIIDTFDFDNQSKFCFDNEKTFLDAKSKDEDFFLLMADWFAEVTKAMENGHTLDFFGSMYEETWKGRGKANALGQFYTPESICRLMAEITKGDNGTYNDCACGSGRTLLAAFEAADKTKFNYFSAGDVDYISCKMCALNFMVHGMFGEVKQQDALMQNTPHVIYKVNEVRYPIPTNLYSIRKVHPKEKEQHKENIKEPTLFD